MKKSSQIIYLCLILSFCLLIFSSCATIPGDNTRIRTSVSLDNISLPAPIDKEAKIYLGIEREQNFTIPQIKAEVVLINVFSTTCPHCQKEAPNTNKLYLAIEDRSDLKGQIKIIGIGTGNSPEDVAMFKKEFKVPFPLFPDKDMSIFDQLGVTATPTMIGVKLLDDGTYSILFRKAGSIGDVSWFIDFLLDIARLDNSSFS